MWGLITVILLEATIKQIKNLGTDSYKINAYKKLKIQKVQTASSMLWKRTSEMITERKLIEITFT